MCAHIDNNILGTLSNSAYNHLSPHLEPVQLKRGEIIYQAERRIEHVYFPGTAVVAMLDKVADGGTIEVGIIGREGMVGINAFLGSLISPYSAVVQISGSARRMHSEVLRRELRFGTPLQGLLLQYTQALLAVIRQSVGCSQHHSVEQRLARLLLTMRSYTDSEEILMTHDSVAPLLGVLRSAVSIAAANLQRTQLVSYSRGRIRIVDRAGLAKRSCECYRFCRQQFNALRGEVPHKLPAIRTLQVGAVETRGRFSESRAILIGFPEETRRSLKAELRHWMMKSGAAENVELAAAKVSEAASAGRPYRLALVYAENEARDMTAVVTALRGERNQSLSLILCTPRDFLAAWTARLPMQFSSAIGLPLEKSPLFNALHGVLAGEELAAGAIPLADYYQLRRGLGKPYRILVVDDDQINRVIIAKQLEMAGHSVTLVADGQQALEALDATQLHYDLIILDASMPVMDGFCASRKIRLMQDNRANTPIIMVSADATAKAIHDATEAGASFFLPKPINANTLLATIEQLCEKHSREMDAIARP